MAKLTLYHAAPSRSATVRWMLEEVGEPYDIHLLKLSEGDQQKPDIWPSIRRARCRRSSMVASSLPRPPRFAPISQTNFRSADLAVPVGDPRRGAYLQWLFFGQAALSLQFGSGLSA